MRLLIAGWQGQVARALAEAAPGRADVSACAIGRPALDICEMKTITRALSDVKPDVVINTAAYTAVDQAESEPDEAYALNRDGAGMLAAAAAERGAAILHLSTDYVFDGAKTTPYDEDDATAPITVYGASKLAGEQAVIAANPRHIIMRTAWVYSPSGRNFVKTMLGLAETRDSVDVVDDQHGSPTYATHLADVIFDVARQITTPEARPSKWGIYHAAGGGEATWCDLANEVFAQLRAQGGPVVRVNPIATAGYPTAAQRPGNSRLRCNRLKAEFGVALPDWRLGTAACVKAILASKKP